MKSKVQRKLTSFEALVLERSKAKGTYAIVLVRVMAVGNGCEQGHGKNSEIHRVACHRIRGSR